ncbi:YopX family protein [Campylobacter coli]|uniref:YopX family protein n=1 Tax=Campylobacter coli TaxID=195 RepID=UPI0012F52558|nr:YopX family protein [Campylobacter coli]
MKLQDFDFRIWDKDEKCFLDPYTKSRAVVKNLPNEKLLNLEIELFTGIKDKNGKKIYEGDILYYFKDCSEGEVFKYQVLFKEGAFYLFESYDGFVDDEDLIAEFDLKELQVMGNIHENKELLNVRL